MLVNVLMVAAGGALGASLRYASVMAAARLLGTGFPWGTLFVNVTGSFLMGIGVAMIERAGGSGVARYAPLLLTGMLGGFTTFSAFSLDVVSLFNRGSTLAAAAYMGGSILLSILALIAGLALCRGLAS